MALLSCVTVSQLSWLQPWCLRKWQLGISSHSKSTTKKKCMQLGSFLVASWNVKDVLQRMRLWQHVWLTVQSVLCLRKVSVMKYKWLIPFFLMMKMHLHQWQLCLVHPWRFLFQIFHLTDQSLGYKWVMWMVKLSSILVKNKQSDRFSNWQ